MFSEAQRNFQEIAGYSSTAELLRHIDEGLIRNCPVSRADVKAAEDIWGPSLHILQGKTRRTSGKHVSQEITNLPATVAERYMQVELAGDVMKVNQVPFMVTISRAIKYITAEALGRMTAGNYLSSLDVVLKSYRQRGFRVVTIYMDGAFECIRDALADRQVTLNVCS